MLLRPDAANYLSRKEDPFHILRQIKTSHTTILFLKKTDIQGFLETRLPKVEPAPKREETAPTTTPVARSRTLEVLKEEPFDHQLECCFDITGNSTCEGELSDFRKYFSSRYDKLYRLLKRRRDMEEATFINRAALNPSEVVVIGIVSEIRETNWGSTLVTIEDKTGSLRLQISDRTECPEVLLHDEVIGVMGALSGRDSQKLFANEIIRPDIPYHGSGGKRSQRDVGVAFLSDVHFGSNTFLKDEWERFLNWINLEGDFSPEERELARKLRYIVIPGDLVDGIGIYPDQDKELDILDIYDQYSFAARELNYIPEHIQLIIQPGNHDAVRMAEPQPALPKRIQELFTRKNISFMGNPSEFLVEGVRILSYHGKSLNDFDRAVKEFKIKDPMPIMKSIMKRRHLAPIYGSATQLAPEHQDYMVMETIPDIFVTGHVHSAGHDVYKGVMLLNASCWQAQTDYQKMMNFVPDPAKLPVVDLRSFQLNMLDFNPMDAHLENQDS